MSHDDRDVIDVQPKQVDQAESLKVVGWVSYALHLIVALAAVIPGAQPSIALLLVALIIDLVKKGDAVGTWQASHFSWRIRTVIWAAIWYGLTLPLWFLFVIPGAIAWLIISVWFLYRIIKGMVRLNDSRPVDA